MVDTRISHTSPADTTDTDSGDTADAQAPLAQSASGASGGLHWSAAGIRIERLILHALDAARGAPLLVDEEVALDERTTAFFTAYLDAALQRADWRARFAGDEGDAMPALCERLVRDPAAFVPVSQELARRLYAQMAARPRTIASGDLVVLLYRASETTPRSLALLKLDPDARLVRKFRQTPAGRQVRIFPAANVLPDAVRLQKCALVTPSAPGATGAATWEIALLDTQAGPRSEGVAAYFYRGFLTATLAPSARRYTRLFLTASEGWISQRAALLEPPDILAFYAARRAVLAGNKVALTEFVTAALPAHPVLRPSLLEHLRAALPGLDTLDGAPCFPVDRATAQPFVRFVTLELDGGARLRVSAPQFDGLVRVAPRRSGNVVRLVVETVTLREGGSSL